eukprot:TRINITY_DN10730_c0_g1_i1.p1 TRINITY_DN10730_c0_g1~~TRINITY_DN10730_c0_g1_i1.p1  ORF type:complete len:965 (+),score=112.30 TRINITY_DN10730_c0_g1_i1:302-2896(+)
MPEVQRRGCLIDGFPRTEAQAQALVAEVNIDAVLQLVMGEATAVKRALGRRNDPETGLIYHLEFVPPPAKIARRLVRRDNDVSEDIVHRRYGLYTESCQSIVASFDETKTCKINSEQSLKIVFEDAVSNLQRMNVVGAVSACNDADDDWSDDEEGQNVTSPTVEVALEIAPEMTIVNEGCDCRVAVSISVPESVDSTLQRTESGHVSRPSTDVCCVVDISGSMATNATYEVDGEVRSDGLTYLDIVKQAVKAVINLLKDKDRFALVAFDQIAYTKFELQYMDEDGRKEATTALESLQPQGTTGIWEGLHAGLEALRTRAGDEWRHKTIMLLTDGMPNVNPPKGHIQMLRDYKESHPGFGFQINTFGFGYQLLSDLLLDLAIEGQGTFSFIPDAVIVGTCFVNCIANILSTKTQQAVLHLTPTGGAEFTGPVLGVQESLVHDASWGRVVSLGPLTFGQPREVVVPMKIPGGSSAYLEAVVVYPSGQEQEARVAAQGVDRGASSRAIAAVARSDTVSVGYAAITAGIASADAAQQEVVKLGQRMEQYEQTSQGEASIVALKTDVQGRMKKALEGQPRFDRWGKHFLRAITRAHQLQFNTNFMDTGLQVYGGELFKALRSEGDDVFLSLPAPTPSVTTAKTTNTSTPAAPAMNTYYAGSGGGCFAENSTVKVLSSSGVESTARVSEVQPGDVVCVADGLARVKCVIRMPAPAAGHKLVTHPSGLTITPRHPVRIGGAWRRPSDLPETQEADDLFVDLYNFVLDRCHVLLVDGVECVTWGHGFSGHTVGHFFYGSNRVLTALAMLPGWEDGRVEVTGRLRDAPTGRVVGFVGIDGAIGSALAMDSGAVAPEATTIDMMNLPNPWVCAY